MFCIKQRGFRWPWTTSQGHYCCSKCLWIKHHGNAACNCSWLVPESNFSYHNKHEGLLKVTLVNVRYSLLVPISPKRYETMT